MNCRCKYPATADENACLISENYVFIAATFYCKLTALVRVLDCRNVPKKIAKDYFRNWKDIHKFDCMLKKLKIRIVQTVDEISVHNGYAVNEHAAFIALNDSRVNNWEASGNSLCAGRSFECLILILECKETLRAFEYHMWTWFRFMARMLSLMFRAVHIKMIFPWDRGNFKHQLCFRAAE